MKIFSEKAFKEFICTMKADAWTNGYNCANNDYLDRDLKLGRITLDEYRQLKYDYPPIEQKQEVGK